MTSLAAPASAELPSSSSPLHRQKRRDEVRRNPQRPKATLDSIEQAEVLRQQDGRHVEVQSPARRVVRKAIRRRPAAVCR